MIDAQTTNRRNHDMAMPNKDEPVVQRNESEETKVRKRAMKKRDDIIFEKRYRDDVDPFYPAL